MQVVAEKSSAIITTAEHDSFYTSEDQLGTEQGLSLAVGLVYGQAHLSNGTIDPTYGELKAYAMSWAESEEGFKYDKTELPTHPCSDEELGLDGRQNSKFMTFSSNQEY